MLCPKCKAKVKKGSPLCKRCGYSVEKENVQPSWKWSAKVLLVIYGVLAAGYMGLTLFL